jgi:DNA primase
VQEITAQADLAHADGRARFAEIARPLVARIPEGVYRELLIERLAEAIRLPSNRLKELWAAANTAAPARRDESARESPRSAPRAGQSAGRGGLMRQAVLTLVHHPRIATELAVADLETLAELDEPGADILRALIEDLRRTPCTSTGQLLERWRDRPEAERLNRLAAIETLIADAAAALREFRNALSRMQAEQWKRRLDLLLEKEKAEGLAADERQELQRLIAGPPARRNPA